LVTLAHFSVSSANLAPNAAAFRQTAAGEGGSRLASAAGTVTGARSGRGLPHARVHEIAVAGFPGRCSALSRERLASIPFGIECRIKL